MALSLFSNAKANDFLSSEVPDELFNIGVRIGLNTSNRTFNKDFFRSWNTNSWGTGIDAGVEKRQLFLFPRIPERRGRKKRLHANGALQDA